MSSEKASVSGLSVGISTARVQTLSFMDVIDRLPPSMIQLLAILAPAIHVIHHVLRLVTWRGGYVMRVQSWLLFLCYILTCMYGYEVLRYAPQAIVLSIIGYAWLRKSFSRVTGQRRAADERGSAQTIRMAVAQLTDIADFVAAVYEGLIRPVFDVLTWNVAGIGPVHLVTFLLVTWPLWLLCVLPVHMWLTPIYYVSTTWSAVAASAPLVALRTYLHGTVFPAVHAHAQVHAPRMLDMYQRGDHFVHTYMGPWVCAMVRLLPWSNERISLQVLPPFPIASLTLRHVLLIVGVVALTWCSPWATLLRAALWRSAMVRRSVMTLVRLGSGSDALAMSLRPSAKAKMVGGRRSSVEHETEFVFEIYENQRWWIGLDWTAALLPQERPSWSDSDNQAVAPPASFSLPRGTRVRMPSSTSPGKDDVRVAEWRWVDPEWHVAGVQTITSDSYTPKEDMDAVEAQRVAKEVAASSQEPIVPEEVLNVARPVTTESGVSMDVDAEGWQYGDNTWEKLSKQSGMGRYTRRRRWLRKAVLIESVEYGVQRND
ncbi:peroxisome organization protein [Malassezia pachydermatis]|uniref:Integral peroxisomal membrane protein n=1 Tax=Malassezia pachydermatis TaxID=77020 RepID=A0A0M9VP87_9BASI|nr:integral peroxisomal membrane protein [Malassezia pachydermatis]KOS14173.1 integral peroxisomal membrane protein [Malassezia pachydermatis]